MMQVIPDYIPEEELKKCKIKGCNFTASSFENIISHNSEKHSPGLALRCVYCPMIKSFNGIPTILDHFEKHSSQKIFICGGCNTFSSCRKLLAEHTRSSHSTEDVVILEIVRWSSVESKTNYYISLREGRKTVSTFSKCFLCDIDVMSKSLEEHLIDHHLFKIMFSCWKCKNICVNNPHDLNAHFEKLHSDSSFRNTKIIIKLKSRFDISDDELLMKKEQVDFINVEANTKQNDNVPNYQIKEEIIDDDVIIDIEDEEPVNTDEPAPVRLSVIPLSKMMDPKYF